MVLTGFLVQDKLGRVWFFEETFLLADTSMEIVLRMPFLAFNNADVEFTGLEKLTWRSYITAKALPTTNWVELIDKKEFAKAELDENSETFVVHVAMLEAETSIHLSRPAQIAALQWDKASIEIPVKYSDYADVFSSDLAMELPENIGINKHAIKLTDGKQPPYEPIYAFSLVELETLKAYIKTYFKTGFIQASSFLTKNLTVVFVCVWIIEVSTTSPSKIGIPFRWLVKYWIA